MSGSGVGDILVSVKIEREENGASTVGLYAEHEVKAELVLGPEQMQLQHVGSANQCLIIPAVRCIRHDHNYSWEVPCGHPFGTTPNNDSDNCVTTGSANVKEEGWGGAGWCALELKLEWGGQPLHQDITFTTQSKNQAETCAIKQERAESESPRRAPSAAQQPSALRPCSVALQSTLLEKLLHKCTICSKTFLHKSSLATHPCIESNDKVSKVITKTERLYICDSCKKHFAFKKDLIRHLKVHSSDNAERFLKNSTCPRECKNKMYPCDICKKKFQKYYLNQHALVHTRDKPYSCDICQKTYRQRSLLIQHKLVHTGNKPYTCEICNKTFIDRSNFMRHKLAHTTDKPYACHICHKTFKHRYSLNNHQVVHTGKKFVCEICNKSFTERSSVNRHLSIHTGERPYACDVCPKTFRRRSYFKSHMQTHGPLGCTVTNVNL